MKRQSQFSRATYHADGVTHYAGWHRLFGWVHYASNGRLEKLAVYVPWYLQRTVN